MAKPKRGKAASAKSREELRRENRQELERQKSRRKAMWIILLVAIGVVIAVILSLTVFFKVTAVEVDVSKSQYSAAQIRDASGIEEGDSLFLLNREKAADRISTKLPYTGEIVVKRSFPSKVKVFVEDSTVTAAVKYNDKYIVLSESDKVLATANNIDALNSLVERQAKKKAGTSPEKSQKKTTTTTTTTVTTTTTTTVLTEPVTDANGMIVEPSTVADVAEIAGGEDIRNADPSVTIITGVKVHEAKVGYPLKAKNAKVFETYKEIRAAMDRWGVRDITAVDLTKVTDIRLTYQQRITILLGSATGLDRKAAMCSKVLEEQNKVSTEQKGTIDLSIEGKAYFSEGGATTMTTTTTTTTLTTLVDGETTAVVTDVDGKPVSTTTATGTTTATSTSATTQDPADIGG
ncbi:MAG: FtsQ-type POTRA domain-containing protein [Clostridia bacterium]|nr:FtsQ-type POTRA domain-containing protein [Clostridia bacterium]MBQ3327947.1 FtsQ-type POTRA domain-containing protein [Clostridia bacterium]MBQ3995298.1 FtsQ-type POTRA domain-containing protein [Clostridia bacterium]MBQ5479925.1 FtsQ-type POTRA domain-containing protein [Clostridia bacterium]MBQ5685189.1 FtsQ-type POTRA domain-containing protein [Clostridia bacterium]